MTKIIFVSDFFLGEVFGGAEFCNESLIQDLQQNYIIEKVKSSSLTPEVIENNKDSFYIIANFFMLSEASKQKLIKDCKYVVYEHDHKYIKSNNPILFVNCLAPETQIQNKDFYKNAVAVMCQSKLASQVVQKNLLINNICNLGGNIWTEEQLQVLEKNIDNEKNIDYGVIETNNKNKGMYHAIEYCENNNLNYEMLRFNSFDKFVENLSRVKTLVFFPQWLETFSRLCIEARILNCKLITNSFVGAASEPYFKQAGRELLETIRKNNKTYVSKFRHIIKGNKHCFIEPLKIPKISIIVPLYKGEKHIKGFLESIESQTIFNKCELIIVNANSPEKEEKYILGFMKKHPNVIYKKLDYVATVMETQNMMLREMATGDFIAQICVDDRYAPDAIETMAKNLMYHENVDLVYADSYQTNEPNETFENNSSNGGVYEHSSFLFSKENMIKCLPGPMPMWRKTMHEKIGHFREELAHAGDWELFLRAVRAGSVFKKIDKPLGLYLYNESGLSTSPEHAQKRGKEERGVFYEYKDVFGETNFLTYKAYFDQFEES